MYYLELTAGEMNYDTVAVVAISTEGKTTPIVMYPQEAGDIPVDVESISGDSTAADNLESICDNTGYNMSNSEIGTVASATAVATGGIAAASFAAGAIDATAIAANAIGASEIADAAIDAATFAAGAIDASAIATGAIDADAIAADAITAAKIANDAIGATEIADAAIDAATFAAGAINAAAIATDAVDADALAADAVTEIWNKAMTELGSVPGVTGSVLQALEWLFLLARNKITQTSTTQTLRNDADAADIATAAVSDNGSTATRAEWA
jgi:hypothetical protein